MSKPEGQKPDITPDILKRARDGTRKLSGSQELSIEQATELQLGIEALHNSLLPPDSTEISPEEAEAMRVVFENFPDMYRQSAESALPLIDRNIARPQPKNGILGYFSRRKFRKMQKNEANVEAIRQAESVKQAKIKFETEHRLGSEADKSIESKEGFRIFHPYNQRSIAYMPIGGSRHTWLVASDEEIFLPGPEGSKQPTGIIVTGYKERYREELVPLFTIAAGQNMTEQWAAIDSHIWSDNELHRDIIVFEQDTGGRTKRRFIRVIPDNEGTVSKTKFRVSELQPHAHDYINLAMGEALTEEEYWKSVKRAQTTDWN